MFELLAMFCLVCFRHVFHTTLPSERDRLKTLKKRSYAVLCCVGGGGGGGGQ